MSVDSTCLLYLLTYTQNEISKTYYVDSYTDISRVRSYAQNLFVLQQRFTFFCTCHNNGKKKFRYLTWTIFQVTFSRIE